MLSTLVEKVEPKHTALIIVDVQNDFCHPDGAVAKSGQAVSDAQAMVPRLMELIEAARSGGTLVVFVQVTHNELNSSEVWREKQLRSEHIPNCVEGTWGAEFYMIVPIPREPIVTKHRYSAFAGTNLDLILRSNGIKTLVMTGVSTNVCVESTARDGFMHDYYIVFVSDCTAAYGIDRHLSTLANIESNFGIVVSDEELMSVWSKERVGQGTGRV